MRKIILIITIAIFQISNAQEISFGAKAGVNFASIGGDDTGDNSGRTSFHIGGVAEYMLTDQFGAQAEVLISGYGSRFEESFEFDGEEESFESTTKLTYLSLPVIGKYYVTENISLEAGPRLAFLLSANEEFMDTFDGETDTEEIDIKEFTNGFDFGFVIGGTYKFENGIFAGLRYSLGLSNINSRGSTSNQNNAFQISGGYKFN